MPRLYPFANSLRLRKNINYPIPALEEDNISLITITPWIELVNKYTALSLDNYSIEDMIKRYVSGQITIDTEVPNIRYKNGNIEILSFVAASRQTRMDFKEDHASTDYLLSFLVDDVVYDAADSWYIIYDGQAVSKEILFHYRDKALWYRPVTLRNDNIMQECSKEFLTFCFNYLNKKEIYQILPVNYTDSNMPIPNQIIDLGTCRKYKFYV
jgi:hypothetical protein